MDTELVKGKPLTKEETKALLELIEASKIITNKSTNATNNKLKVEEWNRIAMRFNALSTIRRRTPQQLRLKWENLKKNARKRNTKIRMNNRQTGEGAGEYIPPDDILDRVTSLLGSTASGFEVPFGGDRAVDVDGGDSVIVGEGDVSEDGGSGGDARVNLEILDVNIAPVPTVSGIVPLMSSSYNSDVLVIKEVPVEKNRKLQFNTPKSGKLKRKDEPYPSKVAKDLAIADYFTVKKKCIQEKMEFFKLTNKKLKLENDKLKLEIENMKNRL